MKHSITRKMNLDDYSVILYKYNSSISNYHFILLFKTIKHWNVKKIHKMRQIFSINQ